MILYKPVPNAIDVFESETSEGLFPIPKFEYILPGRNSPTDFIWNLFDDSHWWYRGDIHNDTTDIGGYEIREFHLVHDGEEPVNKHGTWWGPGNDNDPLDLYIPGAGGGLVPFPLYFTVDMGKKAVYTRLNIKPRPRTPDFSANIPVNFEIWGTNNPKLTTQVGDGSREANLAYWTSWEEANGTDAWKNDGWVKISDCKLKLSSGASHYTPDMPLSERDIERYRSSGFDFDMSEEITEGYRYLRWVINDINVPGKRNLQISEITFWGYYTDE